MKKFFVLFSLVAFAIGLCTAQPPRFRMKKNEAKIYTLTVGKITMDIDANNGARITSLRHDTTEVLSHIDFPNMYGSTFWTSPQKEWNWPPVHEHDMGMYTVEEQEGGAILMTSPLSEKFPVIIKKKFEVDAADNCIVVTYTIQNAGTEPRKVAPWEITRVLANGTVFFDAPVEGITPAGLMNFVQKDNLACYDIDHVEGQNRKINSDGKGWLAFTQNGLTLVKKFQDLDPSQPAPDEAEIQVYVHQGNAYVELESQGAYTNLAPGESLEWPVRWYLMPEGEFKK